MKRKSDSSSLDSCIHVSRCLWYSALASAVKPVANLSPLLCPAPSLSWDKREGQREKGGCDSPNPDNHVS